MPQHGGSRPESPILGSTSLEWSETPGTNDHPPPSRDNTHEAARDSARGIAPEHTAKKPRARISRLDGPPEGWIERGRLKWWGEAIIILSFYGIYTLIRNQFGSELGATAKDVAINNARAVIELERAMGLFFEEQLQQWFIDWSWFIRFWNVYYGTFHFAATITVMVLLYRRSPVRYGLWRTVLAATTGLALVGFTLYPLMPPRLLPDCGPFGACDSTYAFVDTLADPGGFWSFGAESAMAEISNQYAAMPSLHVAWALWCAFAALPVLRRRATRWLVIAYPALTTFAVVVSANHFWIDAVGGAAVLAVGYGVGKSLSRVLPTWIAPRHEPAPSQPGDTSPGRDLRRRSFARGTPST